MNLYEIANVSNLTLFKNAIAKGLKIGYIDIETSAELSLNYGNKKVFIGREKILVPGKVTSVVLLDETTGKRSIHKWKFTSPIKIFSDRKIHGGGDDSELLKKC